mmetsp:Transcript_5358/g.10919  ORF Transcript_5358/g.10919 Transcript_5358/m.10919 type:complete len:87 (-) Transcript_5358:53-313(-)
MYSIQMASLQCMHCYISWKGLGGALAMEGCALRLPRLHCTSDMGGEMCSFLPPSSLILSSSVAAFPRSEIPPIQVLAREGIRGADA